MTMRAGESALEFRRRRAVELMQLDEPKEVIARILDVSRSSLNVWLRKTKAGESLAKKPTGGRPRRLNNQQLAELEILLKKGATAHGWENNLWTTRRVREVIKRHFDIAFSHSGAWHVLQDYLNWSVIRPAQQAAKRDEGEIIRWKAEEFPRIDREAKQRNAYLVFVDESGFMMTPTIRRTFAPRGSTPVNRVFDPHGRISVSGAIAVSPKRTRVALHYFMLPDNVNFRGPSVVEFLRHLRTQIRGQMTILWDQIIIHSSEVVVDFLKNVPDIVTEPFPPYAPELNPVDRAWFYLKYGRLPNFTPSSIAKLRQTVESEIQQLQTRADLLRSFIGQSKVPLAV
jgi:transposase